MKFADAKLKAQQMGTASLNDSSQPCPKALTGLVIVVYRELDQMTVAGLKVSLEGPEAKEANSDEDGVVLFKPLKEGDYTVKVTKPEDTEKELFLAPAAVTQAVTLGKCETLSVPVTVIPLCSAKLRITHDLKVPVDIKDAALKIKWLYPNEEVKSHPAATVDDVKFFAKIEKYPLVKNLKGLQLESVEMPDLGDEVVEVFEFVSLATE